MLRAAVALADEDGLVALSMRRLGQELGVEAMSLYNHVANKADVVDGMVDLVVDEINQRVSEPVKARGWKGALREFGLDLLLDGLERRRSTTNKALPPK